MDVVKTVTSALVAMIFIGLIMMPIVGSMQDSVNNEASNDVGTSGVMSMKDSYTATFDLADGLKSTDSNFPTSGNRYIVTDTLLLWVGTSNTAMWVLYSSNDTTAQVLTQVTTDTLVFNKNAWTFTHNGSSVTGSFTWALVSVPSGGDYYRPALNGSTPAYVDSDSKMITWNVTSSAAPFFVADGTVDDQEIEMQALPTSSSFTALTGVTATYTEGEFTNQLTAVKANQTEGDDLNVNYLAIPIKYQNGPKVDSTVPDLIGIMPVLVIVGLLVALVGTVIYKRTRY